MDRWAGRLPKMEYPDYAAEIEQIRLTGITTDLLDRIIERHQGCQRHMMDLYGRYRTESDKVPIFTREPRFSGDDDHEAEVAINNRVNNDFLGEIVDGKVGYFAGKQSVDGSYKKAIRISRTETHRVREAGNLDAARSVQEALSSGNVPLQMMKVWKTMKDERVRPAKQKGRNKQYDHRKMDGVAVKIDEEFILPSGAKTMAPGQSGVAGEDINCRCYLSYELRKVDEESVKQTGGKQYTPYDENDPRDIFAAKEYRKISRDNSDVKKIARNTDFTEKEVQQIKRHVFYNKHQKYDGYGMLTPDYDMAVAWKRLREGKPEERDILLLHHELLESTLEKEYNLTISEAHKRAKKQFDWEKELIKAVGEGGERFGIL